MPEPTPGLSSVPDCFDCLTVLQPWERPRLGLYELRDLRSGKVVHKCGDCLVELAPALVSQAQRAIPSLKAAGVTPWPNFPLDRLTAAPTAALEEARDPTPAPPAGVV